LPELEVDPAVPEAVVREPAPGECA